MGDATEPKNKENEVVDTRKVFAARLKELRAKEKLSQGELGEKLGISRASVSFYENADRLPDIDVLVTIARHFGVSTDYLCGLTDVQAVDPDLQAFSKQTGLSERAIKALNDSEKNCDPQANWGMNRESAEAFLSERGFGYCRSYGELICWMVESGFLQKFAGNLLDAECYTAQARNVLKESYGESYMEAKEKLDLAEFRLQKIGNSLVSELSEAIECNAILKEIDSVYEEWASHGFPYDSESPAEKEE